MEPLFDGDESERQKREGMALAAAHRADRLAYARKLAKELAKQEPDRTCWADPVGRMLDLAGVPSGPWCGSIFKDNEDWVFTGERRRSERISNHGRELKVWRLKQSGWDE
jgi:hypothetical protein